MKLKEIINTLLENDSQNLQIPSYISQNLSKSLRSYQKEALVRFLRQRKIKNPTNHLMFNMATGSGKTIIMAALMLECYKMGYRNFVFFVNSTSILEKTRANFCDTTSSKYLFANQININGQQVCIKSVNNFDESDEGAINIYFNTIQGLFSLFKNEKENSLTLEDLQNHKIVFLADEAHHLNADTKAKSEKEIKEGWESIIKRAFESNEENLMLEFTATLPNDISVAQKYSDKLLYEYNLKQFCKDGFSKRIFLVKYDSSELKFRFLGACLLNVYREILANENGINLKPVVLFKSDKIEVSKENQRLFNEFVANLTSDEILKFYEFIDLKNELLGSSLKFFKRLYGEKFALIIANHIRANFKEIYQINANDEKELGLNQKKLNTLEDSDNEIRVIFAVDKLNEGWDVLNLFDIVRLGNGSVKSLNKTTTKEAQLIGRGARYFPFGKENKYQRKYDNATKFEELTMIERLSYHSLNDNEYINKLRLELTSQGILIDENKELINLNPSKRAREITEKNEIFYVKNHRYKTKFISNFAQNEIKRNIEKIEIPLISRSVIENEENFENLTNQTILKQVCSLKDKISYNVFAKAMNILSIDMEKINIYCNDFKSKRDFYENFANVKLLFHKKQKFHSNEQLEIAKYILLNFNEFLNAQKPSYEVSEFYAYKLKNTQNRTILREANKVKTSHYEWLYYDKYTIDSQLECEILDFIEANKDRISLKFDEWIVFRNDGFSEFKIYDNQKNSCTYAEGFEPDFIFFGKPKESANLSYLSSELILESKGEHFYESKDKWKENLILKRLNERKFDEILNEDTNTFHKKGDFRVFALPFFLGKNSDNEKFKAKFYEFFGL